MEHKNAGFFSPNRNNPVHGVYLHTQRQPDGNRNLDIDRPHVISWYCRNRWMD